VSPAVGRPSLDSQIQALSKRLLGGTINLDETTDVEDRVLARMEQLDLVILGATTARLSEKGRAMAGGGGPVAVAAPAAPKRVSRAVVADPAEMTWEEPPPSAGGRSSRHWFIPFIDKLKSRPGVWARVMTDTDLASARANSIRQWAKENKLSIQASSRNRAVYARFIGKK